MVEDQILSRFINEFGCDTELRLKLIMIIGIEGRHAIGYFDDRLNSLQRNLPRSRVVQAHTGLNQRVVRMRVTRVQGQTGQVKNRLGMDLRSRLFIDHMIDLVDATFDRQVRLGTEKLKNPARGSRRPYRGRFGGT